MVDRLVRRAAWARGQQGNRAGRKHALEILRHARWGEVIERVRGRIDVALRSNFLPFEGRLKAAGRRLFDAMRREIVPKA